MKRIVLYGVAMLLLCSCQQEPMITVNEEIQASIERKVASQKAESAQKQNQQNQTETEDVVIDVSAWEKLPEKTELEISEYPPNQVNQTKIFDTQDGTVIQYTDFTDDTDTLYQVRTMLPDGYYHEQVFRYTGESWQQVYQQEHTKNTLNVLNNWELMNSGNFDLLLLAPVTVGTSWQRQSGATASITALYKEATLNQHVYRNIVEVTSMEQDYEIRDYYAQNEGLILQQKTLINSGASSDYMQVKNNQHNVTLSQQVVISVPNKEDKPLLKDFEVTLTWQTNQPIETTLTNMFREQKWLTSDVQINRILLIDNILYVDFSSGVVAAMNKHVAGEKAVLPAMVQTLSDYFGVDQIVFTVYESLLSPDILPFPEKGIWKVDPQWKAATESH